ncbi:hypothetical protein DFJ58DRAFT_845389 [Suillus subalutaceus]|uniref:uncharacterized protein n=1 Tax=Suillus subalutaceus TaxID=48586 RepID=UPI001B870C47|nr:uncharacterized protein DFJ58DRAFT_845389 [Suillus subalutaceus]KAG1840387.1 hypothetical protein DFJ58DRAFT_845389 [Suillus subalutaceus]
MLGPNISVGKYLKCSNCLTTPKGWLDGCTKFEFEGHRLDVAILTSLQLVPLEWGAPRQGVRHIAKLPPRKELSPRDKKGQFLKKKHSNGELSNTTLPSSDSLPLDTPEINQRALEHEHEESEHEVIWQLADDKESLTGALDPSAITLPNFNNDNEEKEDSEETENFQFPPVEPPSPPREPPLPPALTPVKPRATQATVHQRYSMVETVKMYRTSCGVQRYLWWINLDAAHKVNWLAVRIVFIAKWPVIVAADKTKLEYQKELLAIHMKEEEIVECITVTGIETWSHVHFHGTLRKLVQDAGVDNTPILIQQFQDVLP